MGRLKLGVGRVALVLAIRLLACGSMKAQVSGVDGPPACRPAPNAPVVASAVAGVPAAAVQANPTPAERMRPSVSSARNAAGAGAADSSVLVASEPMENFGVARYRLEAYGDCTAAEGCYWRDLDAQFRRAEAALHSLVAGGVHGKPAVVFDIDETTLSSYCEMKREDFGYIGSMFNAWVLTPEAAVAIPGALRLFREARAAGLAVFFLTGRPEEQRAATERNLRDAGFAGWQGLVLRNAAQRGLLAEDYKAAERGRMVSAGYTLVLNVGDQWSDLEGEPRARVNVKLPNPFYFLP